MKKYIYGLFTFFLWITCTDASLAQHDVKTFFDQQLSYSARVLQLAEAMPEEKYSWRPMEGVSSVGEVYLHMAQANYGILNRIGAASPGDGNLADIDATDKESVVDALSESVSFVKAAVSDLPRSALQETYELYGRTMTGEQILMFLLNHMSEHVGQSIAYARMNRIVPPWSE